MNKYINIHLDDHDSVSVRHQLSERRPEGYAVIEVGSPFEGAASVLIFPTPGRLARLHAILGAYLEAHPAPSPDTGPAVDVDEVFDGAWAGLR